MDVNALSQKMKLDSFEVSIASDALYLYKTSLWLSVILTLHGGNSAFVARCVPVPPVIELLTFVTSPVTFVS